MNEYQKIKIILELNGIKHYKEDFENDNKELTFWAEESFFVIKQNDGELSIKESITLNNRHFITPISFKHFIDILVKMKDFKVNKKNILKIANISD